MSKITISNVNKTNVTTPSGGTVTLFSDSSNSNNPSVKYSDGSVKDLTDLGGSVTGGTYSAGTVTINNSDGTDVSISGIISDVVLGNIAYVDAVNGDDASGLKGYLTKPYKTISAAESGVTSGDTILVTTIQTNEINLGKDGVTYHFLPGTGIKNTTSVGTIFNDSDKTSSGANLLTFKLTGFGDFISRTNVGDTHTTRGGTLYLYEGSSAEFEFNNSSILNLDGTKADMGYHFWAQAEYINGAGAGVMASLKGKVTRDCIGGHHFLGAHSASVTIDVGGDVDVSAIFVMSQGNQLVDLDVRGKITCGYSVGTTYKTFALVDRTPFFTGNVDTISGTNTFKLTAKMLEWQNSGASMISNYDIFNVIEYNDSTGTHNFNYVDFNIDEVHIKSGDSATKRPVFKLRDNNSETYTRVKIDKSKITVDDGFQLFNIANTNEKTYVDFMFQDCSIDYRHDSLGANAVILDTRYVMFHFVNTRFKVSSQGVTDGYKVLDDSTSTDLNVQIDNIVTNGVVPTTLLNYGVLISTDSSGIRSGVTDIRII
jgi:hypothetical protein